MLTECTFAFWYSQQRIVADKHEMKCKQTRKAHIGSTGTVKGAGACKDEDILLDSNHLLCTQHRNKNLHHKLCTFLLHPAFICHVGWFWFALISVL